MCCECTLILEFHNRPLSLSLSLSLSLFLSLSLLMSKGTNGETDAEFAMSEMLIESYSNIYAMFNKANYASDKAAGWAEVFGEGGHFPKICSQLEKLVPEGSVYFVPEKRVTGGYCIAAALNMGVSLEPACLDAFPKLKAFHDEMLASPAFDGIREWQMYFKRE